MASTLTVWVYDGPADQDRKVRYADGVRLGKVPETVDQAEDAMPTDGAGNISFMRMPDGPYTLWVDIPGFEHWEQPVTLPLVSESGRIAVELVRNGQALTPVPVATGGAEHGFLRNEGIDLVDEAGQPWQARIYHIHTAPVTIAKGLDFGALVREAKGYGFNVIAAIGNHLSDWKKANGLSLDARAPGHQQLLATYFDVLAAEGMRGFLYAGADGQELSLDTQRGIWHDAGDVARGRWNAFACPWNEAPVNGAYDGLHFDRLDLGGVLQARCSMGENRASLLPEWDINLWQSRRGPIHKSLDDSGAGILELQAGYAGSPQRFNVIWDIEPWAFNDVSPDRFGDVRITDWRLALKEGLELGPNCGGGGYLETEAMVGNPLTPGGQERARQFVRGMRAGFLR
jgi:hypothetical protein